MTIKGLSDTRRLPRLGHVRLGIKTTNQSGKEYPKATDYLVVEPAVAKVYGEKPTSLPIMFPIQAFPEQWLKCYSSSRGLICKGDGSVANALIDTDTGEIASATATKTLLREISCDTSQCPFYKNKQCRELMSLQFLLPDVPGFGIWQLDTSSINSIININSTLSLVQSIVGHISMVPMNLVLEAIEVSPDGKKKIVHVVNLRLDKSISQARLHPAPTNTDLDLPIPENAAPEGLYLTDNEEEEEEKEEVVNKEEEKEEMVNKEEIKDSGASPPPVNNNDTSKAEEKTEKKKRTGNKKADKEEVVRFKADKEGLIKTLHIRANDISPNYYEEVIRPWLKERFSVNSSTDCEPEQLKESLDYINRPNDENTRNSFAEAMRNAGYSSNSDIKNRLIEITGKEKGWSVGDFDKTLYTSLPKPVEADPLASFLDEEENSG